MNEQERLASKAISEYIDSIRSICLFLEQECIPEHRGDLPRVKWMQETRGKIRTKVINAKIESRFNAMYEAIVLVNDSKRGEHD